MKRLGKFTRTIYDDSYDYSKCPECCAFIPSSIENDAERLDEYVSQRRLGDLVDCIECRGCPAAKNSKNE